LHDPENRTFKAKFIAMATCKASLFLLAFIPCSMLHSQQYTIVGTNVTSCYDNSTVILCPTSSSQPFYGQFTGHNLPFYRDNGDGTVSDLVTGLMWQNDPDENGDGDGIMEISDKLTWQQIQDRLVALNSSSWGGYSDWRIPSIKELYSLTDWNGTDPSGYSGSSTAQLTPFLDNTYFPFSWGLVNSGERLIDSQYASCTMYNELSWSGYQQLFGFNFADGRIKGYDLMMPGGSQKVFSFIAVRGNTSYGINHFIDNGNATITDTATGLMWMKNDSQNPMNWEEALAWAQMKNSENYCGHSDWRLPNTKELQSIVDYIRSPGSTNSAAIDPLFNCTSIINEAGYADWPWFWTSTTHRSFNGTSYGGSWAVYVCFGRAAGWMKKPGNTYYSFVDVHGAGAQRSSPKSGTFLGNLMGIDSLGNVVYGLGPQGDILRTQNFVRLVRDVYTTTGHAGISIEPSFQIMTIPSNNEVLIISSLKIRQYKLFHLTGKVCLDSSWSGEGILRIPFTSAGIYILQMETEEGTFITRKLILE
jgi:hypothetical protein